jgi:hypothetical protein
MNTKERRRLGIFGKAYAFPHGLLKATGNVTQKGFSAAGNIAKRIVNTVDSAGISVTRSADNAVRKVMTRKNRKSSRKAKKTFRNKRNRS